MRFTVASIAGALCALASASVLMAQDVDQVVHMDGPVVVATPTAQVAQPASLPLTRPQQLALAQGRALRPGVYRFRSLHSGFCLALPYGRFDSAQLMVTYCPGQVPIGEMYATSNRFVVLPHPAGGYTLRADPRRERAWHWRPPSPGEIGNCATVARGVIVGAARIEVNPCDVAGGDWTSAGATDQRFYFLKTGANTYQISLANIADGADCWVLRDGDRNPATEVIRWSCARTPDQMWEASLVESVPAGYESELLNRAGWYATPSGHYNILGADGIDLTGPVFHSFDTANDNGDYCRKRCAETDQCKAWTWTGPKYVTNSNDPPRCYWKSGAGEAINRGPQSFGKLRSGIVRP